MKNNQDRASFGWDKSRKPRVLIVEDDISLSQVYSEALTEKGFDIIIANNSDLIESIENPETIDLIIEDMNVPGKIDGEELFRELHRRFYDAQIIIATGAGEAGQGINFKLNGAYEFLQKPVLPKQIAETAIKALESTKKIRADLESKLGELSQRYQKLTETRYVLALEEDRDLLEGVNGNTNIRLFSDINSLEQALYSMRPASKEANAAVVIRENHEGVDQLVRRQKVRNESELEIPIIAVSETKNYDSRNMLEKIRIGFFEIIPKEKVKVSLEYTFLTHQEKYASGMNGQHITLEQAKGKVEKPSVLIAANPEREAIKNLDRYLTSLGIKVTTVNPRDYIQSYNHVNPTTVLLDPIALTESYFPQIVQNRQSVENKNLSSIIEIIPPEKQIIVTELITKAEREKRQISLEEIMKEIGETPDTITRKLTHRIAGEVSGDDALLFLLQPDQKSKYDYTKKLAEENKVEQIQESLRPNEITRLLANGLLSERKRDTRIYDKDKPTNILYVIAGPTCSGKTETAAKLKERLGNAEIIGNIKPGTRRPGETSSKDEYLPKTTIDVIKEMGPYLLSYKERRDINPDVISSLADGAWLYDHFGNDYHLLHTRITRTLREGKDVILLTNLEGLERIKKMKKKLDLKNEMVSYLLFAQEKTLKERLEARLQDGRITPEELEKRSATLNSSLREYMSHKDVFDKTFTTDGTDQISADIEERVNSMIKEKDALIANGTVEYSTHYVQTLVKKLIDLDMEKIVEGEIEQHFINDDQIFEFMKITPESPANVNLAILRRTVIAKNNGGTYTLYIDGRSENEERRKIFINYLEFILGTPTEKREKALYYPASMMTSSEVSYERTKEPINVSDVALYSLQSKEKAKIHSLALVFLENYEPKKGGIIVKETK